MRSFLLSIALATVVAAGTLVAAAPVAVASETGMASIHSWRKVGRKTCLVDHEHSGSGSGANRKIAEMEAIRSWTGFTDFEYGSSWANFSHAVGKTMRCTSGISGGFQCDLLATACRPW